MTLTLSEVVVGESPRQAQWARISATLRSDQDALAEDLWIEVPERDAAALTTQADVFLAWLAPLAAQRREALRLASPVDATLLEHVREVVRVWCAWFPELRNISIDAPTSAHSVLSDRVAPRRHVASMFTGGVDSFFTVLRHVAGEGTPRTVPIDDLLFVHGFDIPLRNTAALSRVSDSLQQAADSLGKRLVVAATNLRETRFAATDWSRLSHGAALAGVAHALGERYDTVLIGSSAGYRDLRFWGSHPLTDPMLSSSRVRILHDGPAFMRVEKTEYVARSPIARRHLRVCYKSESGDNCGGCNNCYRTMLALDALGVLDDCATFDRRTLDLDRAARIYCRHDFDVRQFGYVRDLAQREGRTDIANAVERTLVNSQILSRRIAWLRRLRDTPVVCRWAPAWERRLMRGWID